MTKKRILILIVAYNAETTIERVLGRIPASLFSDERVDVEVLVIDDWSRDDTFSIALSKSSELTLPIHVLVNPKNMGYGGNQKLGYWYAIARGFDFVALLHGDGQYAPESLPELLAPLLNGECDAVFGSRMLNRADALRGGMPLYKFVGNIILTNFQNFVMGAHLSEWHSGYRIYSCENLRSIPFDRNSNGFDFDTEVIIQLLISHTRIKELAIPTYYGDEICHVNGISYAFKICLACLQSRMQQLGFLYDRRFDFNSSEEENYQPKFSFRSSHSLALAAVQPAERLLILGAGSMDLIRPFIQKGCHVIAVEKNHIPEFQSAGVKVLCADLDELDELDYASLLGEQKFDKVLALDVLEHLRSPEHTLEKLRGLRNCIDAEFLFTVPNVAFVVTRIMLLMGQFNYGRRGILDRTHTRLFTFASFKRLCVQSGFDVSGMVGIPAPFPLALRPYPRLGAVLVAMNTLAIKALRNIFSFQIMCRARPVPKVEHLFELTEAHSSLKSVGNPR